MEKGWLHLSLMPALACKMQSDNLPIYSYKFGHLGVSRSERLWHFLPIAGAQSFVNVVSPDDVKLFE